MERKRMRRKPDPPGKSGKWVVRILVWVVFLYCAWGYRSYMTTKNPGDTMLEKIRDAARKELHTGK